jgi:hypothetical protein
MLAMHTDGVLEKHKMLAVCTVEDFHGVGAVNAVHAAQENAKSR